MQQLLRQGIDPLYLSGQRPAVMLTTLPGEEHQLGLLMAQACLVAEGMRCVSLGLKTPASDIARAAQPQGVEIVGVSFSQAIKLNTACDMLRDLRQRLPDQVEIWAGGSLWARAHRAIPGVQLIATLTSRATAATESSLRLNERSGYKKCPQPVGRYAAAQNSRVRVGTTAPPSDQTS